MNLKQAGITVDEKYAGSKKHFYSSASRITLFREITKAFEQHAHGTVLDVGSGRKIYHPFIKQYMDEYICTDITLDRGSIDFAADGMQLPVKDNIIDTVFSSQVLEHVSRPWQALKEFQRVLKPGGKAILSVPHISNLHNVPHDYFRFTPFGITELATNAGFNVVQVQPAGGLCCFISHLASSVILPVAHQVPGLLSVAHFCNRIASHICVGLDDLLDRKKYMALNYVAVLQKPEGHAA